MAEHRLFRRVARAIGIGTIAASALVVVGPVAATAATPSAVAKGKTPPTTSVDGTTTVKTANGLSWDLIVAWDNSGSPALQIGLLRTLKSGRGTGVEIHFWNFYTNNSAFSFNKKTGALSPGAQTSPVAKVKLAFKVTSSKKVRSRPSTPCQL